MRKSLSILIPTFNDDCLTLVEQLSKQAKSITSLEYEIIVADDGSTDKAIIERNSRINDIENCRFIRCEENRGRSVIRNFLVSEAQYEWLLFVDGGHMRVCKDDFILTYLNESNKSDILYGGYCLSIPEAHPTSNLRYKYEQKYNFNHFASQRNKSPYKDFHTSNFLVRRSVLLKVPFDERFHKYGYEDVLLGKRLKENGATIYHIDNATQFHGYESNAVFLAKTREALQTMQEFSKDLYDVTTLLPKVNQLKKIGLDKLIIPSFRMFQNLCAKNLEGNNPSLLVFKFYKLGYFLNLK